MNAVKRGDAALILAILTFSLCLFLFGYTPSEDVTARIYESGKLTHVIELNSAENGIIEINGGAIEIKDGAVRYVGSNCPDKLCEKFGWLDSNGDTASCVPNKTVVTLSDKKSGESPDVITY